MEEIIERFGKIVSNKNDLKWGQIVTSGKCLLQMVKGEKQMPLCFLFSYHTMEVGLDTMIEKIQERGGYVEDAEKRENSEEYRQRIMLISTILAELFVSDRETLLLMSKPEHEAYTLFTTNYRPYILLHPEIQSGWKHYQDICAALN